MDAVVFMDAMNQPPEATPASARSKKRGISPNAALIAGIGTLLLALGIGVLIGRSGNNSTASAPAPQVVTVAGGSAEEGKAASGEAKTSTGGSGGGKGKNPKAKAAAAEKKPGGSATTILPNNPNVHLPPPKVQIGEKCNKEVAGCNSKGEYDGSFFGGE
jgi:hypothetical protein